MKVHLSEVGFWAVDLEGVARLVRGLHAVNGIEGPCPVVALKRDHGEYSIRHDVQPGAGSSIWDIPGAEKNEGWRGEARIYARNEDETQSLD